MYTTIEDINNEFHRIAEQLVRQGDLDIIEDLITLETKQDFIESWKQNEKDD